MSLLANSNAIETGGYPIQRSLRFRSSASAYLSRTNVASPTNNKIFTFSAWIKRGQLSSSAAFPIISGGPDTNNFFDFFFDGDSLNVSQYSGGTYQLRYNTVNAGSGAVFRDVSAWYHIVLAIDMTQASGANGVKLYVNNVQQTWNYTAAYVQNSSMYPNTGSAASKICLRTAGTNYFDGYLAEVNFIDGQALTPSSFGQTDPVTGVWQPKKYTGTYGTNGFYLPFSDNTSATTLAYDKSGNGNNWTPNNISTTAGATYDSMTDVPTLTSTTAANYCVLNPLSNDSSNTLSAGNLNYSIAANQAGYPTSTFQFDFGKWYWECTPTSASGTNIIGIVLGTTGTTTQLFTTGYGYYINGNKYVNGVSSAYGASYTTNDVIGVAVDLSALTIEFFKNGTSQGSFSIAAGLYKIAGGNGSSTVACTGSYNFGQRPFSYTPPTGFKALNTFNLPDPTIKKPNQYMDATTYTGTGATQSVLNAGSFQPDLVWLKQRSSPANNHNLFDSIRGANLRIASNLTDAEATYTDTLMSFNSGGFTLGADSGGRVNVNAATFVGWQWKKGATPGFDIVTYTGNGASSRTISHSLGVAPKMLVVKNRTDAASDWPVWFSGATSATQILRFNSTTAVLSSRSEWGSGTPTSTTFSVGDGGTGVGEPTNRNTANYVAYLFAEIAGFSKFGSYTGNGSADGPFVYCGFRPKFVLIKVVSNTNQWTIIDTSRDPYNQSINALWPNSSNAENTLYETLNIVSNGFKLASTNSIANANGDTYIYAAFAENPFKYSLAR